MANDMVEVQLPGAGVAPTGEDVSVPAVSILQNLQMLGTAEELQASSGFTSIFRGTPQSVALIEAGATALSKAWAGGLGAAAAAAMAAAQVFWLDNESIQGVLVTAVGIGVAAAVLAIGYIVGSDVRGRSAAAVAVIQARAAVARSVVESAERLYEPSAGDGDGDQLIALPASLGARNKTREATDETGWRAIALRRDKDGEHFLLVKGDEHEWITGSAVIFT